MFISDKEKWVTTYRCGTTNNKLFSFGGALMVNVWLKHGTKT